MDDSPGTGRIVDKCVYHQFLGRKVEKFTNRIFIYFLPPAKIAQSLWPYPVYFKVYRPYPDCAIIKNIRSYLQFRPFIEPEACVAGLKGLVRQAQ